MSKLLTPSKSQLLAWKQDRVTLWMMEQLHRQFPTYRNSSISDNLNKVNFFAGQQNVIEVLEKLCDYIPEDSA